jgi:hypothetical protein
MSYSVNPPETCQSRKSLSISERGQEGDPARACAPICADPFAPSREPDPSNSRLSYHFVSLDRLSFVGNLTIPVHPKTGERTSALWEKFLNSVDFKGRRFAGYPYLYNLDTYSGVCIQIADQSSEISDVRVDFNPNQCKGWENTVKAICANLRDIRITRTDYAIDYQIDLSEWQFTHNPLLKSCTYRSRSGQLETLYLGGADSPLRIRIYNKQLESKLSEPRWRIEAQCRFPVDVPYHTVLPFAGLTVCKPYEGFSLKEQMAIEYFTNHPDKLSQMSKPYARKIRRLIDLGDNTVHLAPGPHELFLSQSGSIQFNLSQMIGAPLK